MRILVVSNFYPPHFIGGYEIGCKRVVKGLSQRGHEIQVLTSWYGLAGPASDGSIHRQLDSSFNRTPSRLPSSIRMLAIERANRAAFVELCRSFRPDVVFLWNLRTISICFESAAKRLGIPASYFVSDDWIQTLAKRPRMLLGRLLSPPFEHLQFCSHFVEKLTLPVAGAGRGSGDREVIHWGVDTSALPFRAPSRPPKRLLFAGRLVRHKGPLNAIRAFALVNERRPQAELSLSIAGAESDPAFSEMLREHVRSQGLSDRIAFLGRLPPESMPEIYRSHEVLLFPSEWGEPFSIGLLEAMASGLAVVSTRTGGSAELLDHGRNAMIAPPGEPEAWASRIESLLDDSALCESLRACARRDVEERFTLGGMLDRVERALARATGRAG